VKYENKDADKLSQRKIFVLERRVNTLKPLSPIDTRSCRKCTKRTHNGEQVSVVLVMSKITVYVTGGSSKKVLCD
jgi:hypothetical protein